MRFESACGSVIGAMHARAGRNGQDGFALLELDGLTVAVVTDGCGSGRHSEVGAKLGAELAARVLATIPIDDAGSAIAAQLRETARLLGGDRSAVVHDYLLFTIVAAVITPELTTVVSAGDGMFAVNGERRVIGPYPGNAPPYIGYALTGDGPAQLTVQCTLPTAGVRTILLGTDGVERIGRELETFWSDELVFRNPDAIRRRLVVLSRNRNPLLHDDATIVVLRKAS